jgi:hypothetical protein
MDESKVRVKCSKENAEEILELINGIGTDQLPLPPFGKENVQDFLSNKRSNILDISINGKELLEVTASKKSAKILMEFLEENHLETFDLVPVPISNIQEFMDGSRDNVLILEIKRTDNVNPEV